MILVPRFFTVDVTFTIFTQVITLLQNFNSCSVLAKRVIEIIFRINAEVFTYSIVLIFLLTLGAVVCHLF